MKHKPVLLLTLYLLLVSKAAITVGLNDSSHGTKNIPVILTFNADVWGARQEMTAVLNLLDKYNIRATFFFLGKYAELEPGLLKRTFDEGHEIGARSYDHTRRLIDMSKEEQREDIKKTLYLIEKTTDYRPLGFAAPGYFYDNRTLDVLKELGFDYDRSARGALRYTNEKPYWRWQNETKQGIRYVGVFSNQRPFQFEKGVYEFPITYALNYAPLNITDEISPLWWEKINGTDVILSDVTWIEELKWNQTRCYDVLRFGLEQQLKFGMPLIVSLAPHIVGRPDWIWVLERLIEYALQLNLPFLSLNELKDGWFEGQSARLIKSPSKNIVSPGESCEIVIHVVVLQDSLRNVTVIDRFEGDLIRVNLGGETSGNKVVWHFKNISENTTLKYVIIPRYSDLLSAETIYETFTFKRTISNYATLESDNVLRIRSNTTSFTIQVSPIVFASAVILIIFAFILSINLIYSRIRLVQSRDKY